MSEKTKDAAVAADVHMDEENLRGGGKIGEGSGEAHRAGSRKRGRRRELEERGERKPRRRRMRKRSRMRRGGRRKGRRMRAKVRSTAHTPLFSHAFASKHFLNLLTVYVLFRGLASLTRAARTHQRPDCRPPSFLVPGPSREEM